MYTLPSFIFFHQYYVTTNIGHHLYNSQLVYIQTFVKCNAKMGPFFLTTLNVLFEGVKWAKHVVHIPTKILIHQ